MDIHFLLKQKAEQFPDKPALIFQDQTISFTQLYQNVCRCADVLSRVGVGKSDKVGVYLPNCPEYVYTYLAGFCLGAVVVPLDYQLKFDEMVSCLSHAEVKVLIAQPKNELSLDDIKAAVPSLETVVDNCADCLAQAALQAPKETVAHTDLALIMYTSGTTGRPKGILLNYKHLEGSPRAMEHFVDLSERDIKLCALPLSHIGGFVYIQNMLIFGITLILMDRFNPFEFLKNVTRFRVTCFHIVPPMYNALLTLKQIDQFDLSSLRWVVVFGAPSSPKIMERFHKYCPNAQLLNGWGMTETCPPNTVTPLGSRNIASVGKPAPHCTIKVVDDKGREAAPGTIGEIVISGWVVMIGYYKDPEATSAAVRDGWLHTGDLGKFDEEGFLYIVGRKKEMIKVGGQIVYAPEVESALYKHDAIAEAAVIGISDKMRGEAVKAFVVLKEAAKVTAEDLRYFAREHLAHFKVPQSIELRDSLPKNRTGKIDKETLKREV